MNESEVRVLGAVGCMAFSALAITLGCPPDRVGEAWNAIKGRYVPLPETAQQAVDQLTRMLTDAGFIP